MAHSRIFVPKPNAAQIAAISDVVDERMAHHRRQAVIDRLLVDAQAPFIRPGRIGKELRRAIAAEGRIG